MHANTTAADDGGAILANASAARAFVLGPIADAIPSPVARSAFRSAFRACGGCLTPSTCGGVGACILDRGEACAPVAGRVLTSHAGVA